MVVVGAATGTVAGAGATAEVVAAEVAGTTGAAGAVGAVRGATGTDASASQQAGSTHASAASTTAASTAAGASTFFSQPTSANAATNTIELIANLIFLFLLITPVVVIDRLMILFITQIAECIQVTTMYTDRGERCQETSSVTARTTRTIDPFLEKER